jgi:3-hydroxyisobutyrate dehydrogenase-like beta-hydroxyacid dehydrogenase
MELLTADQVKLGFIGLGNMGSRIARRLLDHGYQLSVYDTVPRRWKASLNRAQWLQEILLNWRLMST